MAKCIDCDSGWRKANYPGPRCWTHWKAYSTCRCWYCVGKEAKRARKRQADKVAKYNRDVGRPALVDARAAIRHAQMLHRRGMSCTQISEDSGVSQSDVSQIINGNRTAARDGAPVMVLRRTTVEAILAVRYREPEGVKARGARMPGCVVSRRIQALLREGFPAAWIAEQLGRASKASVHQWARNNNWTFWTIYKQVAPLYDKLAGTKPQDWGIDEYASARCISAATRRNFAPSICWDDDTIDDPDAIPEWTGKCGTYAGYELHVKYEHVFWRRGYRNGWVQMRACGPCTDAKTGRARDQRGD